MTVRTWVASGEFRDDIRRNLNSFAAEEGFATVAPEVYVLLTDLVLFNQAKSARLEVAEPTIGLDTSRFASRSLRTLVVEAARLAKSDNSNQIRTVHIVLAFSSKFCQVFPFC